MKNELITSEQESEISYLRAIMQLVIQIWNIR
jgi:hypothetical protein